jgi:hypothetical protein
MTSEQSSTGISSSDAYGVEGLFCRLVHVAHANGTNICPTEEGEDLFIR